MTTAQSFETTAVDARPGQVGLTACPPHTITVECPKCGVMVDCQPAVQHVEKIQRTLRITFVADSMDRPHVCTRS